METKRSGPNTAGHNQTIIDKPALEESMISDSIREFLQKPLIARMSTIDPTGYPHTVPVRFALGGDDIVIISVRGTRKVDHILANPKGAVTIGGDPDDGAGYLIKWVR
jgi:nitroimidazol reductase NimA-like FMN-containing flavoprotein (pyridoxamine 5'-phosphate oxidase superfamily)